MRLIDADALVHDVMTEWGFDPHYMMVDDIDGIKAMTDSLILERINLQPTVSPWHRAEEPPPQEGKYLVCDELNHFYVVWWGPILGWCYDPKRFRYWMPIEPPKEDA